MASRYGKNMKTKKNHKKQKSQKKKKTTTKRIKKFPSPPSSLRTPQPPPALPGAPRPSRHHRLLLSVQPPWLGVHAPGGLRARSRGAPPSRRHKPATEQSEGTPFLAEQTVLSVIGGSGS